MVTDFRPETAKIGIITFILCAGISRWIGGSQYAIKSLTKLCSFSVLVQHLSGDGDEGDTR